MHCAWNPALYESSGKSMLWEGSAGPVHALLMWQSIKQVQEDGGESKNLHGINWNTLESNL